MTSTVAQLSRIKFTAREEGSIASITDVCHLSSYNWIEAPRPTIAVPGYPPLWSPPSIPRQLSQDSGLIYIAQNAARHPEYPLEPLFRSLYIAHPSFDMQSVDLVTDRNNIRKLLSFINPSLGRNGCEPFTINVEVIKSTAVFCRTETESVKFVGPHKFIGFGHEFEKAYTTEQIDGSTGHHRVIQYKFGDLHVMVRYETDGHIDMPVNAATHNTKAPGNKSTESKTCENDELARMIQSLSIGSTTQSTAASPGSKLMIKREGSAVGIESTLEIKTRTSTKPIDLQEVLPQLWVSQTPNLVRAYHNRGIFGLPKVENVTSHLKEWEEEHQDDLKSLVRLLKRIILVVKENGGKASIEYDQRADKLVIRRIDTPRMLPDDLYSKF